MRAARRAKKMSQKQLGDLVGVSQAMISDIETGQVGGSSVVLAICRELGIDPPVVTENDLQRRWVEAGRVLAVRAPTAFRRQLEYIEGLITDLTPDDGRHSGNT